MISPNLQTAINQQINAELWSAYLYLSMSMDAQKKGYPGIAQWLYVQWEEEQTHAEKLATFLTDRMAKVCLEAIESVKDEWDSPMEIFEDALDHERKVTKMINQLVGLALADADYASVSFLQWFVDEQVEEEKNVSDILTVLDRIKSSPCAMEEFDHRLGERKK